MSLALLTGCADRQKVAPHDDVLLGGGFKTPPSATKTTAPMPATNAKTTVPPIPGTTSSLSNAAMTVNGQLVGGRDLRIAHDNGSGAKPGTPRLAVPASSGPFGIPPGGAVLHPPQPIIEPVPQLVPGSNSRSAVLSQTAVANPTAPQLTDAQWEAELRKRGVEVVVKEPAGAKVMLRCWIPERNNPKVRRVVETVADDYPSAAWATLEKLEKTP